MTNLMSESISEQEYLSVISRLWTIIEPLERGLLRDAPEFSARFSYDLRLKTPLLQLDLQHLGSPSPSVSPLNDWAFRSPEQVLGTMYVVEGATLGGKHVCMHLESTLGLQSPAGMRYFYSYGPLRARMWNTFRSTAEIVIEEGPLDLDAVIEGAKTTFERFEWVMNEE